MNSSIGKVFDWVIFLIALYFVLRFSWFIVKRIDRIDLSSDLACWGIRLLGAIVIIIGGMLLFSTALAVMMSPFTTGGVNSVFSNIFWIIGLCMLLIGCFMEYRSVRRHPAMMIWGPR